MLSSAGRALRDERGIALPVAIFALVVIGGLLAGSFLGGLLEQQSGRNTLYVAQAAAAAELEAGEALSAVPVTALRSLPIAGPPLHFGPAVLGPGLSAERQISRLGENLFVIRARGTRLDADGRPLASRLVGLLVRLSGDSLGNPTGLARVAQRPWLQLY